MRIPSAAPQLLKWLDHDVPLLRGDLKRLKQLRKQAKHHHHSQALRQDMRVFFGPA